MKDEKSYTKGLSGTWYCGKYTLEIKQAGAKVTATCDGGVANMGSVVGNVITLHFPKAVKGRIYFDGEFRVIRWNDFSLWTRKSQSLREPNPVPPESSINFGVLFPGRSFGLRRDAFTWDDLYSEGEFSIDILTLYTIGVLDPGVAEITTDLPRRMCFYLTTPLPAHIANLQLFIRGDGLAMESYLISTVDNLKPSVELEDIPWSNVIEDTSGNLLLDHGQKGRSVSPAIKLVVVIGFSVQHHQEEPGATNYGPQKTRGGFPLQRGFSMGVRGNATVELKQIVRLAQEAPPGGHPTGEAEKLRYACEKLENFEVQLSDLMNIVVEQSTNSLEAQNTVFSETWATAISTFLSFIQTRFTDLPVTGKKNQDLKRHINCTLVPRIEQLTTMQKLNCLQDDMIKSAIPGGSATSMDKTDDAVMKEPTPHAAANNKRKERTPPSTCKSTKMKSGTSMPPMPPSRRTRSVASHKESQPCGPVSKPPSGSAGGITEKALRSELPILSVIKNELMKRQIWLKGMTAVQMRESYMENCM